MKPSTTAAAAIIQAAKNPHIERVFAWVNRRMLARHFHQIWATGLDQLQAIKPQPVLFYANHSNWWDGLIAFYLCYELLRLDGYLMMLARQLRKYRFFRWIGAFSVDRDSPISAFRSLEYAAKLLQEVRATTAQPRAVWIFPQGELLPNDVRPLHFLRGLDWLHHKVPTAQLVAVALRYEFLNEQLPEVFLSIEVIDLKVVQAAAQEAQITFLAALQLRLTQQLDQLKQQVIQQQTPEFQPILHGKTSLNILYEQFTAWWQRGPLRLRR